MDIISHAIVGGSLNLGGEIKKKNIFYSAFFSLLPDFTLIILYIYLGIINSRAFWIPENSDWDKFRIENLGLSALWDTPHSALFALFFILPIVYFLKIPKIAFFSYLSHIFLDIFTHTGYWSIKIFWPVQLGVPGFSDMWAWHFTSLAAFWCILLPAILILNFLFFRKVKGGLFV